MRGILSRTRDHLTGAGEALVEIATDYELADSENADVLSQLEDAPSWQEEADERGWWLGQPRPAGGDQFFE